jgi:hypothetical protein
MLQVPDASLPAVKKFWPPVEGSEYCSRLGCEQAEQLAVHPGSLGLPALAWSTAVGLKIEQPATGTAETAHA